MDASAEQVWDECLARVRDHVRPQSYSTWFEPLQAQSLTEEDDLRKLTVQLPSRFYYEWLEEHYFSLLRKTVTEVLGPTGRLFYDILIERDDPDAPEQGASMQLPAHPAGEDPPPPPADASPPPPPSAPEDSAPEDSASSSASSSSTPMPPADDEADAPPVQNPFAIPGLKDTAVDSTLNDGYTFDRFIPGACNQLARNAARSIAQEPGGTHFNPFLVYGGVGLGKTHLIQAIGNHVSAHHASKTTLYVSSERFTTEFVQSIQRNRVSAFSQFYRQVDLLIVDDVQFFSGKEKTQEEFFHIFNALRQAGKQIVLSADRPPRAIEGLEERLLSRFQWGLSADLKPPRLDTRIAILERKAADDGIALDDEVIAFIARSIEQNIRELEGALIRLLAHATLHQREINLPLAREVLSDLFSEQDAALTIEDIQRIVGTHMDVSQEQMRGDTRKRDIVRARQVAMYFAKKHTQHSLTSIGLHFGGRDHSTVIHAQKTVDERRAEDEHFRETVDAVARRIERHGQ
jgi:chromosomal replication initiator protein